jgi:HSP20 family protein
MLLPRFVDNEFFGSLKDMHQLQSQLNRLLSEEASDANQEFPLVNIWTSPDCVLVRAEIPGIDLEKMDISLVHDTLTIRGSRSDDMHKDCQSCHRKERQFGHFVRTMRLPFEVNGDLVKAGFKDGILEITLPRAEADKPRKISVLSE